MLEPNRGQRTGVNLVFDDHGFKRALSYLLAIKATAPATVSVQLNKLAFDWQRFIKRHMPVDEGHARRTVAVIPSRPTQQPIMAVVGTNTPYTVHLEFGYQSGGRGLFAALRQWKPGDDPIRHWYAKDRSILALMDRRDTARSASARSRAQATIDKATDPNNEEFAPPFRGSWPLVAQRGVERLRKALAEELRKQARK